MPKHAKFAIPQPADLRFFRLAIQFDKAYFPRLGFRTLAGIAARQINAIGYVAGY